MILFYILANFILIKKYFVKKSMLKYPKLFVFVKLYICILK